MLVVPKSWRVFLCGLTFIHPNLLLFQSLSSMCVCVCGFRERKEDLSQAEKAGKTTLIKQV